MKRFVLNRKTYKEIKKYDHQQMSDFLEHYYKNGYNDGFEAGLKSVSIDYESLKAELLKIKGIGEKRANEIVAALKAGDKEC